MTLSGGDAGQAEQRAGPLLSEGSQQKKIQPIAQNPPNNRLNTTIQPPIAGCLSIR